MKWVRADLHIHSVLSPCTSLAMSPHRIVAEARARGLDVIALCDHNAAANVPYVRRLAAGRPAVLCGLEIQSEEEVEVLAYFPDEESALKLAEELYPLLPDIPCDPEIFGDQVVVNEHDDIVGRMDRLLLSPVPLPLEEVVRRVHERGGLVVPAHVDRAPGGLLAVLGFFPPGPWSAVEIAPWTELAEAEETWPELRALVILRSSDAHMPEEIGRAWTEIAVREICFEELVQALGDRTRVRPSPPAVPLR